MPPRRRVQIDLGQFGKPELLSCDWSGREDGEKVGHVCTDGKKVLQNLWVCFKDKEKTQSLSNKALKVWIGNDNTGKIFGTDSWDVGTTVGYRLLSEVEKVYTSQGKITDDLLSSLQFVFQAPLLPALDLVDKRAVSMVTCPSGRFVFQVIGSSGIPYICFQSSIYCSCPAYRFSVLLKEDHVMCKHALAAILSERMGLAPTVNVTDKELTDMLREINSTTAITA